MCSHENVLELSAPSGAALKEVAMHAEPERSAEDSSGVDVLMLPGVGRKEEVRHPEVQLSCWCDSHPAFQLEVSLPSGN